MFIIYENLGLTLLVILCHNPSFQLQIYVKFYAQHYPPLINVNNFENLFTLLIYKELQPISNSPKVNNHSIRQKSQITTPKANITGLATNKKYAQRKAILLYAYLFLSDVCIFLALFCRVRKSFRQTLRCFCTQSLHIFSLSQNVTFAGA